MNCSSEIFQSETVSHSWERDRQGNCEDPGVWSVVAGGALIEEEAQAGGRVSPHKLPNQLYYCFQFYQRFGDSDI